MPLPTGHTLGTYRIESHLGAGGMGEVYKATDSKLGRAVALKLLPASFAQDPERLARFQREARTLAALNHPHIAQVYDAGTDPSAAVAYIAMELIDGEDLAQRIARGAIPVPEAIAMARQIVQALDAAHERGIVHRDLKPANIKVREDGTVKVLDFGLAKAVDSRAGGEDPASAGEHSGSTSSTILANSPTMTSPSFGLGQTSAGMILGTAGYMSPEQAKGRPVDKRADIWAFGVVFYEMLTGQSLFSGETVTDVVAAVMRQDISLDTLPAGTPPAVRAAIARCLERDPRKRLRDIADLELDRMEAGTAAARTVTAPPPLWRRIAPWAVAAAGIAGTWAVTRPAEMPPPAPVRTSIDLPPGTRLPQRDRSIALSPDGRRLAIVLEDTATRKSQLHIRALDSGVVTPVEGTAGATYPFWSPDGSSVGFFVDRELRRYDFPNGPARTITSATEGRGADWGPDNTIVFVAAVPPDFMIGGLYRVAADGRGPAESIATQAVEGYSVHSPSFLPGGKSVFLSRRPTLRETGSPNWQVVDIATGAMSKVSDAASEVRFAAPGWLLFAPNNGLLMAQPFDLTTRAAFGQAQAIADRISPDVLRATANVTQAAGVLIFQQDAPPPFRQLAWFDLEGRRLSNVGDPAQYESAEVSPDGRRAIVADHTNQLWIVDLQSGIKSPFFAGPNRSGADVVWSRDGRRVAFRDLSNNLIVVRDVDDPDSSRTIGKSDRRSAWGPTDWTPDGKTVIFDLYEGLIGQNVAAIAADGSSEPRRLAATPAQENEAKLSPDGRWLAYLSDESGTRQVYVTTYPEPGVRSTVTTAGGESVLWLSNTELAVRDSSQHLSVITLQASGSGVTVTGRLPALGGGVVPGPGSYSTGTRRFLIATLAGTAGSPSLVVLTHWVETLRR